MTHIFKKTLIGIVSVLALCGCSEKSVTESTFDTTKKDTTVATTTASIDYTPTSKDGMLSSQKTNYQFAKAREKDISDSTDEFIMENFNPHDEISFSLDNNLTTLYEERINSSNPDIIPVDAIKMTPEYYHASNVLSGGKIRIDLSKVKEGTSYIRYYFKSGNLAGTRNDGALVFKVDIIPFGNVEYIDFTESIDIDCSKTKVNLTNAKFFIFQDDIPYGCTVFGDEGSTKLQLPIVLDSTKHFKTTFHVLPELSCYLSVIVPVTKDGKDSYENAGFEQRETVTASYQVKWYRDALEVFFHASDAELTVKLA